MVVRRSRLDLQEIDEYASDLVQQNIQLVIPNDPEELTYDLSELKDLYLNTLDRISKSENSDADIYRFKAARYSPALYVLEEKKENGERIGRKNRHKVWTSDWTTSKRGKFHASSVGRSF